MDDRLLFLVAGILACLRAVQHALLNHDHDLSPQHKAAIDEWKKRTPMSGKEISFIKNSRDLILKEGAFPGGAGFRWVESVPNVAHVGNKIAIFAANEIVRFPASLRRRTE